MDVQDRTKKGGCVCGGGMMERRMGSAVRVITCSTRTRRRRTCLGSRSTAPFESAETWTILSHSTVYRRHSSICCAGCTAKRGTCFFRCFSQSTSASSSCSSSSSSLRLPFCDHELDITYHSPSHLAELPCLCLHERPRWTAIVCCGSRTQTNGRSRSIVHGEY